MHIKTSIKKKRHTTDCNAAQKKQMKRKNNAHSNYSISTIRHKLNQFQQISSETTEKKTVFSFIESKWKEEKKKKKTFFKIEPQNKMMDNVQIGLQVNSNSCKKKRAKVKKSFKKKK